MDARPVGSENSAGSELDDVDVQLTRLPELSIAEHVEVFAAIHRQLTDALAVTGGQPQPHQAQPHQAQPGQPQPHQPQPGQPQPHQRQPGQPRPGMTQPAQQRGR